MEPFMVGWACKEDFDPKSSEFLEAFRPTPYKTMVVRRTLQLHDHGEYSAKNPADMAVNWLPDDKATLWLDAVWSQNEGAYSCVPIGAAR